MTVSRIEHFSYRGKNYDVPIFDPSSPIVITPDASRAAALSKDERVVQSIDTIWNLREFERAHRPVSVGVLSREELDVFAKPEAVRILDMPIKMPDCDEYRLPRALAQFENVVRRIADSFHRNCARHADYHAYLTIDQRSVAPGTLHREAPCHVDGFQGARWNPKCLVNHTFTVSDALPTAYYVQPFDFRALDESVHDFFWEMNAQVAETNEEHKWQPRDAEITMMDAYSVHRGVENATTTPVFRTWFRLSFEERRRVFDRLGNAHNPLFDYDWKMVDRDIEQLGLRAFRQASDASLRVFPWQDLAGNALPKDAPKTKPRLHR